MPRLIVLVLLFSSCSFFVKSIDTPVINEKDYRSKIPTIPTYCPLDQDYRFQLIGSNAPAQDAYHALMSDPEIKRLDNLDHFAIWSLLQISIRPDQSSPTSRLQVLIQQQNKSHYFDFFSEVPDEQFPYLYGIEWVLNKFGKKTRLETYSQIIQKHLKKSLKVSNNLEFFLESNAEALKKSPELSKHFVRGSEVLKETESIPEMNYELLLKHYRKVEKAQKIIVNTSLNTFNSQSGGRGSCNYDFNLYNNSIFLIDSVIPDVNLFGLIDRNFSFMSSSSQKLDQLTSLLGLPIFKGISRIRSSAVCVIENDYGKIWTFSNKSRDPGQHLFQLMRYGLTKAKSVDDVDRLIRHSRYLFLYEPTRLIIESGRSQSSQIENLLKLKIPIYNAEKLGNIWAYTSLDSSPRFVIDDRNSGTFLCK